MQDINYILNDLIERWDAIVSLCKNGKRIVFLNEVEYMLDTDEQLQDFYDGFCKMNKYLD
jgi:hypothetical protein